jgi:hypothetical protein
VFALRVGQVGAECVVVLRAVARVDDLRDQAPSM